MISLIPEKVHTAMPPLTRCRSRSITPFQQVQMARILLLPANEKTTPPAPVLANDNKRLFSFAIYAACVSLIVGIVIGMYLAAMFFRSS